MKKYVLFLLIGFAAFLLGISIYFSLTLNANQKSKQTQMTATSHSAKPYQKKVANEIFSLGYMYWATPQGILSHYWYVVFTGVVLETHKEYDPSLAKKNFVKGKLEVQRILLSKPEGKYTEPPAFRYFETDAADGLKKGDKVIVIVNQFYENDYAQSAFDGSNCLIGIKVNSWDSPIISAVEEMAKCEDAKCRKDLLKQNPKYIKLWNKYDKEGIKLLFEEDEYQ